MDRFSVNSLLDQLHVHTQLRPEQQVFTFLADGEQAEASLTFAELNHRAREIAAHIQATTPKARRALLMHAPGLAFVTALIGCFYAGISAIPCYPPTAKPGSRSGERFRRILHDARAELILTDSGQFSKILLHHTDNRCRLIDTESLPHGDEIPPLAATTQPADIALIQYTSGSTGNPKGVILRHANLLHNLEAIQMRFGFTPDSRMVSWLPPYHDMGLIGCILSAVYSGYPVIAMAPRHFLQKPVRWLQAIQRYQADTSGAPNFAYELCAKHIAEPSLQELDLSCWSLAFCGAEPVRATTMRRFAQRFAPAGFRATALFPCYGLAEVTLMATAVSRGTGAKVLTVDRQALARGEAALASQNSSDTLELVSSGSAGSGIQIQITDPETRRPCTPGTLGEIWLSGASIADGYWDKETESKTIFGHRSQNGADDHWLRSGDLGFMWDDELFVSGRLKELIILRGNKYHPPDLEAVVGSSHPALALNGCVAFSVEGEASEALVILGEIRREQRKSVDVGQVGRAIQAALFDYLQLRADEILLLKPGALPRTTSGKLMRVQCRERYLDGAWQALAITASETAAPNALANRLLQRIAAVLRIPQASLDMNQRLGELGIDSLKRVELAMSLEQESNGQLDIEQLTGELTLAELARLIQYPADPAPADATGEFKDGEAFATPGRAVPLTPLQHAFLYSGVEQLERFIQIVYLRTPKGSDPEVLQRALQALERRYDSLRLRFIRDEQGNWQQVYATLGRGIQIERIDVAGLSADELRTQRATLVARLKSGYDLARGPLVRGVLFDRGETESGILGIGFHHLVIDISSASIFVMALQQAYTDALAGKVPEPAAEPEFGPWLVAMERHAQRIAPLELDYWCAVCGEQSPPPTHEMQPSTEQTPWSMPKKRMRQHDLSPDRNRRLLRAFPTAEQRHNLFLAALAAAWCQHTGKDHALILLETHGRQAFGKRAPLSAMGWFVCQYPVRISSQATRSIQEQLVTAEAVMESVPGAGEGYGLLSRVCQDASVRQRMSRLRRPPLKLTYRGSIDDGLLLNVPLPAIGSESVGKVYYESLARSGEAWAVELYVTMTRGVLSWKLVGDEGFLPDATIGDLADAIQEFLVHCLGECAD